MIKPTIGTWKSPVEYPRNASVPIDQSSFDDFGERSRRPA